MQNTIPTIGDPTNMDVFSEPQEIVTKSGLRTKSTEPYAKELLKLFDNYFNESTINSNFSLEAGQTVEGAIAAIDANEITLDINQKEFVYINVTKDKIDAAEYSIGQTLEVLVLENQDEDSYLKASISGKIRKDIYADMIDYKSKTVYDATVTGLSNNGYDLNIKGLSVFMPGSLGGINKLVNFEDLVGQTIKVMTIKNNNNYSKYKDTLIVSHREYLRTLIPGEVDKLEIGANYTGTITDTTKFGIFVEFASTEEGPQVLTGLIHKDEFDEGLAAHYEADNLKAGIEVEFYIKEVVTNNRIILTRHEVEKREKVKKEYKRGDIVNGKITNITTYGAFVQFGINTSGLIHISKFSDDIKLIKGNKISCKITNVKGDKYELQIVK